MAILKLRDDGRLSLDDAGGAVRARTEGAAISDERFAEDHRARPAHACRRAFPKTTRGATSSLPRAKRRSRGCSRPASRSRIRRVSHTSIRTTASRSSGRIITNVSGQPYRQYIDAAILRPLGMTLHLARAARPFPSAGSRIGYRWEDDTLEARTRAARRRLRRHGRHADVGRRTSATYVGALLAAWPPRDGPESGPVRRASLREMQQIWRATPGDRLADAGAARST